MSTVASYRLNNPRLYTYNQNLIDITKNAKLIKENSAGIKTQNFDSDVGFNYDPDKVEFSDSKAAQKNIIPSTTQFGAPYQSDFNGAYGNYNLTATIIGNPVITDEKLDLTGNALNSIYYDWSGDSVFTSQFSITLLFTPNYTGSPATSQMIADINDGVSNNNRVYIMHAAAGDIICGIYDSAGAVIGAATGTFSPIAGAEYKIELVSDVTGGADSRLFLDDARVGSIMTGTGTRNANITQMQIGTNMPGVLTSNFSLRNLSIRNIRDVTSGNDYFIPCKYAETFLECPVMSSSGTYTLLESFIFVGFTVSNISFNIKTGTGSYKYYNGSSWIDADGTRAQSSSYTQMSENISLLDVNGASDIQLKIFFCNSNDQASTADTIIVDTIERINYPTTNPIIEFNQKIRAEKLIQITDESISIDSLIRFILSKDGVNYWYNGSSWDVSNGAYEQSNIIADINTNAPSFTSISTEVGIIALLHSNDGSHTPILTSIDIEYDFGGNVKDDIEMCTIYGYAVDMYGDPISEVRAELSYTQLYKTNVQIEKQIVKVIPNMESGYWEMDLPDTENMHGTTEFSAYYIFYIDDRKYKKYITAVDVSIGDVALNELTDVT